jgi:N-sulfoglucosamine sulfohydrolase
MASRPDIVFITCHDLGRHLGCYGVSSVRSPSLDRVAAEGVRFANSFCTSPGCSPSRAAIATGRYPHANGVLGLAHSHFGWELGPEERHVARLLGEAGYYPALFGLQHVTFHLPSLGFREVHDDRPADAVARNVAAFLKARDGQDQPLYLEINFFEPHRPFDFGGVAPDTSQGVTVPAFLPQSDAARQEFALMQGAIHKMDAAVGQVRAALEAAGRLENTLLVFTADHGIAFPMAKGTLYDPGITTALLMRWPAGGIGGGRVLEPLVSNVDLAPTLLEIAGAEVPERIQGGSLCPLLAGEPYEARECVFAEKTFHNEYDPLRCVRTATHKLIARLEVANRAEVPADIMRGPLYGEMMDVILGRADPFELYDLRADPLERRNLAGTPEVAAVEAELKRRLVRWMRETDDPLLRGPVASPFYHRTRAALEQAGDPSWQPSNR